MVSDTGNAQKRYLKVLRFQSALRFAVVSDLLKHRFFILYMVSIRFEVRGGFRPGRSH